MRNEFDDNSYIFLGKKETYTGKKIDKSDRSSTFLDKNEKNYFEMLRFCRITERNSLRNSRNENGGRPRFTGLLNDVDDDDDVVLFDEVELLAV